MTSETLSNTDLRSVEIVLAEKIDLDDFVHEFNSRHDNRTIKFHWVDADVKFWRTVDCAGTCVRIMLIIVYLSESFFWFSWGGACFPFDKTVIKTDFWTIQFRARFLRGKLYFYEQNPTCIFVSCFNV